MHFESLMCQAAIVCRTLRSRSTIAIIASCMYLFKEYVRTATTEADNKLNTHEGLHVIVLRFVSSALERNELS